MSRSGYELSAAARLDLLQIWNYLAENASFDVADRMSAHIQAGIETLVRNPGLGHRRADLTPRDLRFYRVQSWLIIYRPESKPLSIVRVVHAARDVRGLLEESS